MRTALVALALALGGGAGLAAPLLEIRGEAGGMDLTAADIFGVAVTSQAGGPPAVTLRLRPAPGLRFIDLTRANIDRPIAILICGTLVAEPVLRSGLAQPLIPLVGPAAEAAAPFVPALRGETACPG